MDTENKTADASEPIVQTSSPVGAAPVASNVPAPVEQKVDSAQKSVGDTPKRSSSSMLFLVVVVMIVSGVSGFVLGQGSAASNKNKQQAPIPTPVQTQKTVTTKISGSVKTDAHGLDYLVVDVSEFGSVKATNHETRYVLDPQANIEYSYSFAELKPNVSYILTMQGCAEKGQATTCVLSKKVVSCSGRIPGGAVQQCLINGDGQADFFLDKSLVNEFVSPTGTPTPTPEPPTATPTP
jgi:hypothetical protein